MRRIEQAPPEAKVKGAAFPCLALFSVFLTDKGGEALILSAETKLYSA